MPLYDNDRIGYDAPTEGNGYLIEYNGPLSGPKAKALGKLLVPILALLLIGFFGNEWLHAAACVAACVLTHTWDGAVQAWRKDKA